MCQSIMNKIKLPVFRCTPPPPCRFQFSLWGICKLGTTCCIAYGHSLLCVLVRRNMSKRRSRTCCIEPKRPLRPPPWYSLLHRRSRGGAGRPRCFVPYSGGSLSVVSSRPSMCFPRKGSSSVTTDVVYFDHRLVIRRIL